MCGFSTHCQRTEAAAEDAIGAGAVTGAARRAGKHGSRELAAGSWELGAASWDLALRLAACVTFETR